MYPHSIEINFNEVKIFKIGTPQLPDSLLPMGMKAEENNTKIFQIQPCNNLKLFNLILFFSLKLVALAKKIQIKLHCYNFVILKIATALVNHLLSVSNANEIEDDLDKTYLIETNIAGYLVV